MSNIKHTFDPQTYRHYLHGVMSVLHCHHYMGLTTKLAEDCEDIGGIRILRESAEDALRELFDAHCSDNSLPVGPARIEAIAGLYPVMGLGRMAIEGDEAGGKATLSRSHVDAGWIKKWGAHDRSINHFTSGYLAAAFASAFGRPARSYQVSETASIVKGDPESTFVINAA